MILLNLFVAGFAKLPLIPPYLSPDNNEFTNGLNYASAGAGAMTETNVGMVCDLFVYAFLFFLGRLRLVYYYYYYYS